MSHTVSKSDWKHFKDVRVVALERLCKRILADVCNAAADESNSPHERFLSIYKIINDSNDDIARGFDHLSRSRMLQHLAVMQSLDLMDDGQVAGFSDETQEQLARFAKFL